MYDQPDTGDLATYHIADRQDPDFIPLRPLSSTSFSYRQGQPLTDRCSRGTPTRIGDRGRAVFQGGQERFQGFSVGVDGSRVVILPDSIQIKQAERKGSIKMM
jgi:hypothetical protein